MEWETAEETPPNPQEDIGEEEVPAGEDESEFGSPEGHRCYVCEVDFDTEHSLLEHILQHVSLPSVPLEKLKGYDPDDEEEWPSELEDYEDEEEAAAAPLAAAAPDNTLSKLLSCITVKKVNEINQNPALARAAPARPAEAAGATPKKPPPAAGPADLMQRLERLGAIKLKLKKPNDHSDFQVVNGEEDNHDDMELDSPVEGKQEMSRKNSAEEKMDTSAPEEAVDEKPDLSRLEANLHLSAPPMRPTEDTTVDTKPVIRQPVEEVDRKPREDTLRQYREDYRSKLTITEITDSPAPAAQAVASASSFVNNSAPPPSNSGASLARPPIVVDSKEGILRPPPKLSEPCAIIDLDSDDSNDVTEMKPTISSIDIKPTIIQSAAAGPVVSQSSMSFPMSSSNDKQHSFDWNAPLKGPDMTDKNTAAILDRLLASKDDDASEYISLENLGSQQSCEMCNMRFTSPSMLEQHKKTCPSQKNLILPQSRQLAIPGNEPLGLLSNLLPVKHIADQMRLGTVGSMNPFPQQQNVLINIQSFPGQMGQYPQQPYPQYPGQQPGFPGPAPGFPGDPSQNMYRPPHQDFGYGNRYNPPGQPPQMSQMQHSPQHMMQQACGFPRPGQPMPGQMPGQPFPRGQSPQPQGPPSRSPFAPPASQPNMFDPNRSPMQAPGFPQQGKSGEPRAPQSGMPPRPPQPGAVRPPGPGMLNSKDPRGMKKRVILRPNMRWQDMTKLKMNQQKMMKRPMAPSARGGLQSRTRPDMLLPGRHDNDDCHVMSMQRQINGMPVIDSVKGSRDSSMPNIGDSITITKTKVPQPKVSHEASKVANLLLSRGIMVKPKAKPQPVRQSMSPLAGLSREVSVKQVSKASNSSSPFGAGSELGLPVVDLSQKSTVKRLNEAGISHFIPLSRRETSAGCFGIPIVTLNDEARSGLQSLGAQGLLSLGPMKRIPF